MLGRTDFLSAAHSRQRLLLKLCICILPVLAALWPLDAEAAFTWREAVRLGLVLLGQWLVCGAWLRQPKPFASPALWALSALFAVVMVFGQSYLLTGTAALVRLRPLPALFRFLARAPLYYALMCLLTAALSRSGAPCRKGGLSLRLGGGLLLCWLPYLYFIFPGTVSNDSITQVMEIIGVEPLGNANPIFQTALIYLFRGVGVVLHSADAAVFLYCGLQALLMAWLMGFLLKEMSESGAPRWLCRLSFWFLALCPVFPLFAFCMGKDTNFSMAVLWLSLLTLNILHSPVGAKPAPRETLCLCLAGVLCTLLRNPGFYLAILTLGILLLWSLCGSAANRAKWRAPAAAMASVLAVYGALHLLIIPALDIAPMPETENWSLPLQQTARVAATHGLTSEEAAAIDGVLVLDELPAAYNGELSDPVKFLWKSDATSEQIASFFRVWRGFLVKYPATCLSSAFHNTYGYLYPGYMSAIKPTLLIGRQKRSTPEVENAFGYSVNPHAESLKTFTDQLAQLLPYRVLIAPGLYGWLCLYAVATLLMCKEKRLLIAAVPALFSLMGCMLSAVNGYFRYAMPLYLCAPLLLWLCTPASSSAKEGIKS